jgi:hypothetical protein
VPEGIPPEILKLLGPEEQPRHPLERTFVDYTSINKSANFMLTAGDLRRRKDPVYGASTYNSLVSGCSHCLTLMCGTKPDPSLGHKISAVFSKSIRKKKGVQVDIPALNKALFKLAEEGGWACSIPGFTVIPFFRIVVAKNRNTGRYFEASEICPFAENAPAYIVQGPGYGGLDNSILSKKMNNLLRRYFILTRILYHNGYQNSLPDRNDVLDHILEKCFKKNELVEDFVNRGLIHLVRAVMLEMLIRSEEGGRPEDRWWEKTEETGRLMHAGNEFLIGEKSIWFKNEPAEAARALMKTMLDCVGAVVARASKCMAKLNSGEDSSEDTYLEILEAGENTAAATKRKQEERRRDAEEAESERVIKKKQAMNQKRRERYFEKKTLQKESEERMLGKRLPLEDKPLLLDSEFDSHNLK